MGSDKNLRMICDVMLSKTH